MEERSKIKRGRCWTEVIRKRKREWGKDGETEKGRIEGW